MIVDLTDHGIPTTATFLRPATMRAKIVDLDTSMACDVINSPLRILGRHVGALSLRVQVVVTLKELVNCPWYLIDPLSVPCTLTQHQWHHPSGSMACDVINSPSEYLGKTCRGIVS